jgi:hypothetical protein
MDLNYYLYVTEVTPQTLASVTHPQRWGGVLAFVSEHSQNLISPLQTYLNQAGIRMVGAVFPELLVEGEFKHHGILLLRFQNMPDYLLLENLNSAAAITSAVETLTRTLPSGTGDCSLFLIFDALVPNIGSFLDEVFRVTTDEYHFMGANAGSETFQPMPCLFDNKRLIQGGVLAMLIPNHPGAVLAHGYTTPNRVITATSTVGNRIISIDWRPAFEVYSEIIAAEYDTQVTKDNFYQLAVHFPFGIMRMDGKALVRIPVALQDDGSLFCVGEIPENSLLTLMRAPRANTDDTVNIMRKAVGELPSELMLGFYCAGRRMHLGPNAATELKMWQDSIAPTPLIGALSLGEIGSARHGGYPLFHNATLVSIPWN